MCKFVFLSLQHDENRLNSSVGTSAQRPSPSYRTMVWT